MLTFMFLSYQKHKFLNRPRNNPLTPKNKSQKQTLKIKLNLRLPMKQINNIIFLAHYPNQTTTKKSAVL